MGTCEVDLRSYLELQQARVNQVLDELLPAASVLPERLHEAMRYSVFAGGKRLRPTLVVADARGSEVRRWVGWLPPKDFVAELAFCRALADFNRGKFAEAAQAFGELVERETGSAIHPEALYWHGIAGFMAGPKDWAALKAAWGRLAADYPGHRFGTHASVIEDAPE